MFPFDLPRWRFRRVPPWQRNGALGASIVPLPDPAVAARPIRKTSGGPGAAFDVPAVGAVDPQHIVWHGELRDATPLLIRPIRPNDAASEQAFVRALSPGSRRKRFGGALNELSPAMLERFTRIDPTRETALVAFAVCGERLRQVGVARYVIDRGGHTGEFALVVSDELHRRGVGAHLMELLLAAARDHGLERLRGEVLADNREMLGFVAALGFSARPHPADRRMMIVERAP